MTAIVANLGGGQIHLVPTISKVGGDASHAPPRGAVAPMCETALFVGGCTSRDVALENETHFCILYNEVGNVL